MKRSIQWRTPGVTPHDYIIADDDHQLIRDAQALVDRAQREGSGFLFVPRWMLEQLIERATRPHD